MNEQAINKIVEMYADIEQELLLKIVDNFKYNEEFTNSDYWRMRKLEEMGLFNEEIIEYISKATKTTPEEIKKTIEEIGYKYYDKNSLTKAFENGKITINPETLIANKTIETIINNAYEDLNNSLIKMSSKIEAATRDAYLEVVESAYLKTSMGTHSYQEAIRSAINDLGNKGITTLTYTTTDEAGEVVGIRNYDIESAVRREVLTATRQLAGNISKEETENLNVEYVYLSEHLRCRPTHFDWQGTIIKYEDLVDVTGYGEVDGLCGINCAHYFEPYFGDARGDELKTISKEEATTQYNLSQQQRYLERGIRKWKRKKEMFRENGDEKAFQKCKDKELEWQKRIDKFTKDNNLKRDFSREFATQNNILFGDNIIEKDFESLDGTIEHLIIYDVNSSERLLQVTNNSKNSVGGKDAIRLLRKSKKNTLVAAHNHPSGSTFSLQDIKTFNHYDSINLIVVNTDEYLYYLEKNGTNKVKEKSLVKNYTKFKSKYYEIYGEGKETLHKLNADFSKEMGWNYGRTNKRQ